MAKSDQAAEGLSGCILNMSINGDSSASLDNLFQCLTDFIVDLVFFAVFVGGSFAVAFICWYLCDYCQPKW